MSDSGLSDAPSSNTPPDSEIRSVLQEEVKKAAHGPPENYTVSKIRKAAEESLDLPEGFFKGNEKWKPQSKTIIEEQVAIESSETKTEPQRKPKKSTASVPAPKKPAKRGPSKEKPQPRKKQKIKSDEETSALSSPPDDSDNYAVEEVKPKRVTKDKKQPVVPKTKATPKPKPKPEASDTDHEPNQKEDTRDKDDDSDSEMSVVLDEAPAKKQRSKSKSMDVLDKKPNASKAKPKPPAEMDLDQEEIKKMQGWLVKCGIRKVWGKELKPFETSKAKIKHLKGLLAGAGMTGRYSNEKAAQIKEARELAADIEAVQEGNERWGKGEDEDQDEDEDDVGGDTKSRGGRRLVRGAKNYDFLSSDGEETD